MIFCFFCLIGLYTYHVFPAVLERQKAFLFWNPAEPHVRQQGSWPTLGARHLLSEWQEIICAWGYSEKSNDPTASWRNSSLRTPVSHFVLHGSLLLLLFLSLCFIFYFWEWAAGREASRRIYRHFHLCNKIILIRPENLFWNHWS